MDIVDWVDCNWDDLVFRYISFNKDEYSSFINNNGLEDNSFSMNMFVYHDVDGFNMFATDKAVEEGVHD